MRRAANFSHTETFRHRSTTAKHRSYLRYVFRKSPSHVKAQASPPRAGVNSKKRQGDSRFDAFKEAGSILDGLNIIFHREHLSLFERFTTFANETPFPLALPQNGIPHYILLALPSLAQNHRELPVLLRLFERHYKHLPTPVTTQLYLNVLATVLRLQDFVLARKLVRWVSEDQTDSERGRMRKNAATWTGLFAVLQATPIDLQQQIRPLHHLATQLFCDTHGPSDGGTRHLRRQRRPKVETLETLVCRPDLLDSASIQKIAALMQQWNNAPVIPRASFVPSASVCLAFLQVYAREANEAAARIWLDRCLDFAQPEQILSLHLLHLQSARNDHHAAAKIASSWTNDRTQNPVLQCLGHFYRLVFADGHAPAQMYSNFVRHVKQTPQSLKEEISPTVWNQLLVVIMQQFAKQNEPGLALETWDFMVGSEVVNFQPSSTTMIQLCQALADTAGSEAVASVVGWYGKPGKGWSNYEARPNDIIPVPWKGRPSPHCFDSTAHSLYQSIHIDMPILNVLLSALLREGRRQDFFNACPSLGPQSNSNERYPDCRFDGRTLELYLEASFQSATKPSPLPLAAILQEERPEDVSVQLMWLLIDEKHTVFNTQADNPLQLDDMIRSSTLNATALPYTQHAIGPLQRRHFHPFVRLLGLQGNVEDIMKAARAWRQTTSVSERPTESDINLILGALDNAGASNSTRSEVQSWRSNIVQC